MKCLGFNDPSVKILVAIRSLEFALEDEHSIITQHSLDQMKSRYLALTAINIKVKFFSIKQLVGASTTTKA